MMIYLMQNLQLHLRWAIPRDLSSPENIIEQRDNNFCIQEPSSMGGAP